MSVNTESTAGEKVLGNPELVEMIFGHLTSSDIRSVRMVSRFWKSVVDKPKFWKEQRLTVRGGEEECSRRIQSHVIKLVPRIFFDLGPLSPYKDHLRSIFSSLVAGDLPELKSIKFLQFGIKFASLLDTELLSQAIVRLESFNLDHLLLLRPFQISSILKTISQTQDLKLKCLYISKYQEVIKFQTQIDLTTLIKAVVKLEDTGIELQKYVRTPEEVQTLFTTIAETPTVNMKELSTDECDISSVTPEILASALVRVGVVEVPNISQAQAKRLITKIASSEQIRLESISGLRKEHLSAISVDILIKAEVKLRSSLGIHKFATSQEQINSLFTVMAEDPVMNIKKIELFRYPLCVFHIPCVPPDTLASALVRIKRVEATKSKGTIMMINPEQLEIMFHRIASCRRLTLEWLTISMNNLSSVPGESLGRAVVRLSTADLSRTGLTSDQVQSIFSRVANSSRRSLRQLIISKNDLSSVPSEDLVEVVSSLTEVDLTETNLTSDQTQRIFQNISESERLNLKQLNISKNNLSFVRPEVLVRAMSRLEEINLESSALNPSQVIAIYIMIGQGLPKLRRINLEGNDKNSVPEAIIKRAEIVLDGLKRPVAKKYQFLHHFF